MWLQLGYHPFIFEPTVNSLYSQLVNNKLQMHYRGEYANRRLGAKGSYLPL